MQPAMGIFSNWSIFQKPEAVLERQLQANAYHPFQLVTDEAEHMEQGTRTCSCPRPSRAVTHTLSINYYCSLAVFVYSARHGRFYFYLLSAIASLLFAVIWHSTDGDGVSINIIQQVTCHHCHDGLCIIP